MAVPVSALQSLTPGSVIELFQLQLDVNRHGVSETYNFHAGTNEKNGNALVWAGTVYSRLPIEADGFEYNGTGQLPRPRLRVSNILGTITALILTLPRGLEGAKVTRIRTLARYLDAVNFTNNVNPYGTPDPTAEFPREVYFIDRKSAETRDAVEFELAAAFDLAGVRAPKRQVTGNVCQWVYRSAECGYTGTNYFDENDSPVGSAGQDVCGKRFTSCVARFSSKAELPFGAYPGIGSYLT
jgi:lambda family phage minor tail protein L